jgi:hypothetical protein
MEESLNFKFRSWGDFLYNLDLRVSNNIRFSDKNSSNRIKREYFNDTESLDEACKKLKTKAEPTRKKELFDVQKKASKMFLSDTPFDGIDIPSFLSGGTDYWTGFTSSKRRNQKKIVKTIFLNIDAASGISVEQFNNYLTNTLIKVYNNYIFEKVVITSLAKYDEEICQFYIDIPYKEVIVIFRTGYSDFCRRIMFFFQEQSSLLPSHYGKILKNKEIKKLNGEDSEVFCFYN